MPTDTEKLSDAARLRNGRYSDEYVAERIAKYEVEIGASPDGIDAQIRSLAGNAGYIMSPENKPLPDYFFARECLYLAIINLLKAESTARNDTIAKLERERDEAIAHDRQPYPTADAYERVCAALHKKTDTIAKVTTVANMPCPEGAPMDFRIGYNGAMETIKASLTPAQPGAAKWPPCRYCGEKVYFSEEHSNFYCESCCKGQGQDYFNFNHPKIAKTQPEASEPVATTGLCVYFTGRSFACSTCGIQLEKHPHPPEPAAPPDSPERCAHAHGLGRENCAICLGMITASTPPTAPPERCEVCDWPVADSWEKGCVKGNCSYRPDRGSAEWYRIEERRKQLRQPPTAPPETREPKESKLRVALREMADNFRNNNPFQNEERSYMAGRIDFVLTTNPPDPEPETRDAARERLQCDFQGQMKSTLRYWYNWNKRIEDDETALDAKFDVLLDIIANYIEARAAAAGGKRNE